MKLAYWMYAGPAHIGVLRVSSSFKNVHAIMHAPLGDDYFNVMRSMLERERDFTPVTASIVDRHVLARGSQEKVVENITRKNKEESPDLILLTPTCTSSILQEDLHNFVERSTLSLSSVTNQQETTATATTSSSVAPIISNLSEHQLLHTSNKDQGTAARHEVNEYSSGITNINPSKNFVETSNFEQDSTFLTLGKTTDKLQTDCINNSIASFDKNMPDIILADVNHYRINELQAADRTLEQIVRYYIEKAKKQNNLNRSKTEKPSVNIIGIFTLGFHNQHDCRELKRLFNDLGIKINCIIPEGGNVNNLKKLPQAWFNFVPYREVGLMTATYLKSEFNMPYVSITPMGLIDTALCIREIGKIIGTLHGDSSLPQPCLLRQEQHKQSLKSSVITDVVRWQSHTTHSSEQTPSDAPTGACESPEKQGGITKLIENIFNNYIDQQTRFISQAAWFSRSIDCQNLTGKKVVVFGDATHSAAMTKILVREMGIHVCCAGTYCKHDADWFREQVSGFCDQILITDDHTQVGDTIANLEPAAIFGTQMERHVGKRLDIPCGVISAPVHIQNFPLGYRPFLGYEGTNQIADLVYNSFNLGMEDHLLQIFGGHDSVANSTASQASFLPGDVMPSSEERAKNFDPVSAKSSLETTNLWSPEGLSELKKVPGFVRGKVKRNTEKYALQHNISVITVEVMYAAKEALSVSG